ncbi:MAG: glycosyltransferase family protein [Deltaproteobacteria bacterium]|nr:glycosyltransferase family protein [Deltaproteobacteria bacterium]
MKPAVCAIIQARIGSSRLPGKVLRRIDGKPLLGLMLERSAFARGLDQVIVATTDATADNAIARLCDDLGVSCFRGSENDVLDRYYAAATEFCAEAVVRLTSDCPLIDPAVIDHVVAEFNKGGFDYVSNTAPLPSTWPDGMDVEVFSFEALRSAWRQAVKPSDREHVTFYLWKNPTRFRVHRVDCERDLSEYRLTVDYQQDFELVEAVFRALYPSNPAFTIDDITAYLDDNPNVKRLNEGIVRNAGWQAAYEKDTKAGF